MDKPNNNKKFLRGHSLYTLVNGPSWELARIHAKALNGELVVIDDQTENDALYDWLLKNKQLLLSNSKQWPRLWIGITDQATEGYWLTINGQPIKFRNWADGEPNNADNVIAKKIIKEEDYGLLDLTQNGKWNDSHQQFDPTQGGAPFGIAELVLDSKLEFTSPPREGSKNSAIRIKIHSGFKLSPVNNVEIFWKLIGINSDDLFTGKLQGSIRLLNGQCEIPYELKLDDDYGETLQVSIYSDQNYRHQIGESIAKTIEENRAPTSIAIKEVNNNEHSVGGTVIAILSCSDPDSNGPFNYQLVKGNGVNDADNSILEVHGDRLISREHSFIDFETNSVLDLFMQVTDNGAPQQSLVQSLHVNVRNIDELVLGPISIETTENTITINYPQEIMVHDKESLHKYFLIKVLDVNGNSDEFEPFKAVKSSAKTIELSIPNLIDREPGSLLLSYGFFGDNANDLGLFDGQGKRLAGFNNQLINTYTSSEQVGWHELPKAFTRLKLSGNNTINGIGNNLNNVITGNSGNNVIDGKAGKDTLAGGAGNDTYIVDAKDDVVIENENEGIDTIISNTSYELPVNVENLDLTGTSKINAKGNDLDNLLNGNSADNVFTGDDGNDTIDGKKGNDVCDYTLVRSDIKLDLNADRVIGSGNDILLSIESFWSGGGNDRLIGNGDNNVITGGAGNDVISGGGGNDALNGDDGDDTFIMDVGNDKINGGNGNDTVDFSGSSKSIVVNLKSKSAEGSGDDTLTSIEKIIASEQSDIIIGDENDNSILGNDGNDYITGALGADLLNGGRGFNIFKYANFKESCLQSNDRLIQFDASKDTLSIGTKYKSNDFIDLGTISNVSSQGLEKLFVSSKFNAASAGFLRSPSQTGYRNFLIVNDSNPVFSANSDFFIELIDFKGNLNDIKII